MKIRGKTPFDHTGSSLDSLLEEEGILDEVEAAAIKRVLAWQAAEAMEKSKISKKAGAAPTENGMDAAVVQEAEAYQRLLDIAARTDAEEGIRQGLEGARKGKLRPAREFFAEFEATHGLSR